MNNKKLAIAKRSIIWNILFYACCFFEIFYLLPKEEIKNLDCVLPFLPILFWGCSTDSWARKGEMSTKALSPYNYVDSVAKVLTYTIHQYMFRKFFSNLLFWVMFAIVCALSVLSFICSCLMIRIAKNKQITKEKKIDYGK